jgi:hypothetical protein
MLRNLVAVFFCLSAIVIFVASLGAEISHESNLWREKTGKAENERTVSHHP